MDTLASHWAHIRSMQLSHMIKRGKLGERIRSSIVPWSKVGVSKTIKKVMLIKGGPFKLNNHPRPLFDTTVFKNPSVRPKTPEEKVRKG